MQLTDRPHLPEWVEEANRRILAQQRQGVPADGPVRVLSIPGRKSGKLRTTPVSPFVVDGRRYLVSGLGEADWVKNARAAGWGILAHGSQKEQVRLTELPVEETSDILREFPRRVPGGIRFFTQVYSISANPEEFAALAYRCPVFRIEDGQTEGF